LLLMNFPLCRGPLLSLRAGYIDAACARPLAISWHHLRKAEPTPLSRGGLRFPFVSTNVETASSWPAALQQYPACLCDPSRAWGISAMLRAIAGGAVVFRVCHRIQPAIRLRSPT